MAVKISGSDDQTVTPTFSNQSQVNSGLFSFGITSTIDAFGSGGEYYEKLFEIIKTKIKILNDAPGVNAKYNVVKLLKHVAGLNYSGIVLAQTKDGITSSHILMVEKTGDYPDRLIENIGGVRYEILRTPGDALDDKYVSQAKEAVAVLLNISKNEVNVVDGTLVPVEFDITNESLVNGLLDNAFKAVTSENYIRATDYKGENISNFLANNKNGKFYVSLFFNNEDSNFIDQIGMPVRQDICIALSYKRNTNINNRSINQGSDTFDIVKTYGYIDFEWSPTISNGVLQSQKFVPNFVITHIDSPMAPTPDILALAIASVFSVNEDMNWMQAFRTSPTKKGEIDLNDIGALNVEGNIEVNPTGFGALYNTKSNTFTAMELNKYIQTLIKPGLIVSIDVPKAGPETWFTSVFSYIAYANMKEAYNRLNTFIYNLTNGGYNYNGSIFIPNSNKVHSGYYRTKNGIKDIRHLSCYLGVANYVTATNQSPMLITQYTNTLYNSSIPSEFRASERKKYIDDMSGKTAVYKQFHDRLTFNSGFLGTLLSSLKMAGFAPMFSNMGAINDMFQTRSTVDFSNAVLGNDARILGQHNIYGNWAGTQYGYTRNF